MHFYGMPAATSATAGATPRWPRWTGSSGEATTPGSIGCFSSSSAREPSATRMLQPMRAPPSRRSSARPSGDPIDDAQFEVTLHHTAYIAAHNAERNDEAAARAEACMELYERAGVREGYLLSRINLGDARWGKGQRWAAERLLRAVRTEAVDAAFAHPRALSALCLANVIADESPEEARALYNTGIGESNAATWRYDELYGRIYLALLEAGQGDHDGSVLHDLSTKASSRHLAYLADVASGFGAMCDAAAGRVPRAARELLQRTAAAPLARAYAAAALLAGPDGDRASAKEALFATLRGAQGLKGRPRFVASMALEAATTDAEHAIAQGFADRFRP